MKKIPFNNNNLFEFRNEPQTVSGCHTLSINPKKNIEKLKINN